MCYLISRVHLGDKSLAVKCLRNNDRIALKRLLYDKKPSHVEIFSISNPDAYGEYAPYEIIDNYQEFIERTLKL